MAVARTLKCLLAFAVSFASLDARALSPRAADVQDIRTPGFYLSPRDGLDLVPSLEPIAGLDIEALKAQLLAHPEREKYRVVTAIPSLLGDREFVRDVRAALGEMGLKSDIKVMRWPNGTFLEAVLDFFPRRSDWQTPLKDEIRTGHQMVFLGELFSMIMMGAMVVTKKLTPELGLASVGLDLGQQAIFAYPLRAYSNYQRRQTVVAQTVQNILIALAFSQNFYSLFNFGTAVAERPAFWPAVLPGTIISTVWGYSGVLAFKWEGSAANRMSGAAKRVFRSKVLLIQQMALSPMYIYSMSPFAKTLFTIHAHGHNLMDVKAGHLAVLSVGLASAAAIKYVDQIAARVSDWAEGPGRLGACVRWLSGGDKVVP